MSKVEGTSSKSMSKSQRRCSSSAGALRSGSTGDQSASRITCLTHQQVQKLSQLICQRLWHLLLLLRPRRGRLGRQRRALE